MLSRGHTLIALQLKMRRNALVYMDMQFQLGTVVVAAAVLVTAVFSQNLHNGLEAYRDLVGDSWYGQFSLPWILVVGASGAVMVVMTCISFILLRFVFFRHSER
eukprot:Tamp_44413.p1 GENE.Tamp_44413~~Tamp_44413.p1  ORF type:complete len:104 (+),score=6.43 Tamp_44413:1-312(+)